MRDSVGYTGEENCAGGEGVGAGVSKNNYRGGVGTHHHHYHHYQEQRLSNPPHGSKFLCIQ